MPVLLANGQSIAIGEASAYSRDLWTQWVAKYGALATYKAAWADYDGSYIGWFAQRSMHLRQIQIWLSWATLMRPNWVCP